MKYIFQAVLFFLLMIAGCTQIEQIFQTDREEEEIPDEPDAPIVAATPEWFNANELYAVTDTTITVVGEGVSTDSIAAAWLAREHALANYKMSLRDEAFKNNESGKVGEVSLEESEAYDVLQDENRYHAFIKFLIER